MKLVVTGTPATGKTTLAKALARKTGGGLVSINDLVKAKALAAELRGRKKYVVEGHLACEVRLPADAVIVVRCDPLKLRARYAKRGYSKAKARENLLAEALDYCLVRAEVTYGRGMVLQVDATSRRTPEEIIEAVRLWKGDKVDWSRQMLPGGRLAFLLIDKI